MSEITLREHVQAIVNRWDGDQHDYRGRVMIMQLKAVLAAEAEKREVPVPRIFVTVEQLQQAEKSTRLSDYIEGSVNWWEVFAVHLSHALNLTATSPHQNHES